MHRGQPAEVNVVSEIEEHVGIDSGADRQKKRKTLFSLSISIINLHVKTIHVFHVPIFSRNTNSETV